MRKLPILTSSGEIRETRRLESDGAIMQESILRRGYVRIRIHPHFKHAQTGQFAGVTGGAITLDVDSVAASEEFLKRHRLAVLQIIEEMSSSACLITIPPET
jgi:hypothetical protein